MIGTFGITTIFALLMFVPLFYTVTSIRSRHHFLQKLTGKTKPEEESSYEIANKLALTLPLSSLALCALEAVLYFVYNRQFHTWCKILKEEEGDKEKVEVASEDVNSDAEDI